MIKWETIETSFSDIDVLRAKVLGGWLVVWDGRTESITFYPDPNHKWDGSSLP